MKLDTKRLKYFVDVCEVGSLTGASLVANVTQPVLSYHIAELERQVGDRLFHRRAHGIELSETGKILLSHAKEILQSLAKAEQALQERSLQPTGSVSVGLLTSLAPSIGPGLLAEARTRFPKMTVALLEGDNHTLRNALQSGRLDLAVTLREDDRPATTLMVEDMFLFGLRGRLKNARQTIRLEEALQYPLVLPPVTHSVRRLVEDAGRQIGTRLKIEYEVEGLALLKSVVLAGHACGILGFAAIRGECESGVFAAARIVKPNLSRDLVLQRSMSRPSTSVTFEMGGLLTKAMESLAVAGRWRRPPDGA